MTASIQDISAHRFTNGRANLRRYHHARWDQPGIFELSQASERGVLVPELEPFQSAQDLCHASCVWQPRCRRHVRHEGTEALAAVTATALRVLAD